MIKEDTKLISHPKKENGNRFFKKAPLLLELTRWIMDENAKECQECGWRGLAAELNETNDDARGQTQIFCPDCGGIDIQDLDLEE
jgi:DNA-directed RNA polymerase subunit RPC12/RpoP